MAYSIIFQTYSQERDVPELIEITSDNFETEVLHSTLPVLVDFGAEWCGPCKMLDPVVDEIATELEGKLKVCKLDIDNHANIAMNYQVMSVPTLILFKNGQVTERLTGFRPKQKILGKLAEYI